MNLKLCYITGWSLLVATGLSAQNRGDLAVKVARDSGQVIDGQKFMLSLIDQMREYM